MELLQQPAQEQPGQAKQPQRHYTLWNLSFSRPFFHSFLVFHEPAGDDSEGGFYLQQAWKHHFSHAWWAGQCCSTSQTYLSSGILCFGRCLCDESFGAGPLLKRPWRWGVETFLYGPFLRMWRSKMGGGRRFTNGEEFLRELFYGWLARYESWHRIRRTNGVNRACGTIPGDEGRGATKGTKTVALEMLSSLEMAEPVRIPAEVVEGFLSRGTRSATSSAVEQDKNDRAGSWLRAQMDGGFWKRSCPWRSGQGVGGGSSPWEDGGVCAIC